MPRDLIRSRGHQLVVLADLGSPTPFAAQIVAGPQQADKAAETHDPAEGAHNVALERPLRHGQRVANVDKGKGLGNSVEMTRVVDGVIDRLTNVWRRPRAMIFAVRLIDGRVMVFFGLFACAKRENGR